MSCQLAELKSLESTRAKSVDHALQSLPTGLDETYGRMLRQISPKVRDEAFVMLQWLGVSKTPLTMKQLQEARLIDPSGQGSVDWDDAGSINDITRIMGNLVQVYNVRSHNYTTHEDEQVTQIQLAHFSVKEFLFSERAGSLRLSESGAHHFVSQSCLAYLMQYSIKTNTSPDSKLEYPLLSYAAEQWPSHLLSSGSDSDGHERTLLANSQFQCDWTSIYDPESGRSRRGISTSPMPALYCASLLGLVQLVVLLLHADADVHACSVGSTNGTALHAALRKGHLEIAKALLRAGADTNYNSAEKELPLITAVQFGSIASLQMLIQAGADVNSVQHGGEHDQRTALQVACENTRNGSGPALGEALIKAGAELEASSPYLYYGSATALHIAVSNGSLHMARMLLLNGADVNACSGDYSTPLNIAILGDDKEMVKILLSNGARATVQILESAVDAGLSQMVDLLEEEGSILNALRNENMSTSSRSAEARRRRQELKREQYEDFRKELGGCGTAFLIMQDAEVRSSSARRR